MQSTLAIDELPRSELATPTIQHDWTQTIAASIVAHALLPPSAIQGLHAAFLQANVQELRVVLANGGPGESTNLYDVYTIIHQGVVSSVPLDATGTLAACSTLADKVMQCHAVLEIVSSSPKAELYSDYADWQDLRAAGVDWVMCSPMCCQHSTCTRLLGAVQLGGIGFEPTINADWLEEWSCELAHAVAHASVNVMEASLDMLHIVFPPNVVDALIRNAVASHGLGDTATAAVMANATQMISDAAAASLSPGSDTNEIDEGDRSPTAAGRLAQSSPPNSPPAAATYSRFAAQPRTLSPASDLQMSVRRLSKRGSVELNHRSPFAMMQIRPSSTAGASRGSSRQTTSSERIRTTSPGHQTQQQQSESLQKSASAQLAAAVLRQTSLQSQQSIMNQILTARSSPNSELDGYEDLLRDDMEAVTARRASQCLERAHSQATTASHSTHRLESLGTDCTGSEPRMSFSSADSPRGSSVENGHRQDGHRQDGHRQDGHRQDGHRQDITMLESLHNISAAEGGSKGPNEVKMPVKSVHISKARSEPLPGNPSPREPPPSPSHRQALSTISETTSKHSVTAMPSGSLNSQDHSSPAPTAMGSGNSHTAEAEISLAAGIAHPAFRATGRAVGSTPQLLDLTFEDPAVERAYMGMSSMSWAAIDRFASAAVVILVALILGAIPHARTVALTTQGVLWIALLLFPGLVAANAPSWWVLWRSAVLVTLRLMLAPTCGYLLEKLSPQPLQACLFAVLAVAFPLPLRVHIPVQLMGLWATVEASFANMLLGFVIPSAFVWVLEGKLRRQFMQSLVPRSV